MVTGTGGLGLETARPSVARMYDFWLGGKDHYAADRLAAQALADAYPAIASAARANRAFHQRAAAWMARRGIRQFLDVGCGLPTADNTHQVVRRQAPDARVAYVDNDPQVVVHARALLANHTPGVVAIYGDVRTPETTLRDPAVRGLLRPGEPTGVLLTAVLHFVSDLDDPHDIVRRYVAHLAAGSYIAISHGSADSVDPHAAKAGEEVYRRSSSPLYLRTREEVQLLFQEAGLVLIPPYLGAAAVVTACSRWAGPGQRRPDRMFEPPGGDTLWCGVGEMCR